VPPPRDLFSNFERMRREVDELFGDVMERGLAARGHGAFTPSVDVFYEGDPPRAIVHAELPGVDPAQVTLEVRGRELLLSGRRPPPRAGGRLYQQVEIENGAFRRVVQLGADVVADEVEASYRDGILEVTLPLARPDARSRRVPINRDEAPE
jgi:HSP20 family protein